MKSSVLCHFQIWKAHNPHESLNRTLEFKPRALNALSLYIRCPTYNTLNSIYSKAIIFPQRKVRSAILN